MKRITDRSNEFNDFSFCDINWITGFDFHSDSTIAEYFEGAADRIIEEILTNRKGNAEDGLFIPVAFLYRHAFELRLKEIIRLLLKLDFLERKDLGSVRLDCEHSLEKLLKVVEPPIKAYTKGEIESELNATRRLITDLHNIDPSGQSFRYLKNKSGKLNHEKFPENIRFDVFRGLIHGALKVLEGLRIEFSAIHDQRTEENRYE
ncbi:MAG: hypothetical protein LAT58_01905 [Opitutales bacterium]|nr:hypothetical protein [Opitutales bacterium]